MFLAGRARTKNGWVLFFIGGAMRKFLIVLQGKIQNEGKLQEAVDAAIAAFDAVATEGCKDASSAITSTELKIDATPWSHMATFQRVGTTFGH